MKKIIITGGTGLIGRPLVQKLAAEGHQITILTRSPQKNRSGFPAGVSFVGWDARTLGPWAEEVDGADIIINLASENIGGDNFLPDRWTDEKRAKIRQSRIESSQAIVQAVASAERKPEVLLQSSAIGYYGPHGDEWVDEHSAPGQDFLASVALEWENASREVEHMGVSRVIMRIGLVLTTAGGPLARIMVPFKLFAGGPYGRGRQWYSWIHLADVVRAIVFLIDHPQISGPVNLVSPHPVTNKAFAKALGRAMDRPALIPVPSFAMKILTGEASMLVLDGQRVSSEYIQDAGFEFRFPDIDEALRDLINNEPFSDKMVDEKILEN